MNFCFFLMDCPRIGQGFSLLPDCIGVMGQAMRQAQGPPKSAWLRSVASRPEVIIFVAIP